MNKKYTWGENRSTIEANVYILNVWAGTTPNGSNYYDKTCCSNFKDKNKPKAHENEYKTVLELHKIHGVSVSFFIEWREQLVVENTR